MAIKKSLKYKLYAVNKTTKKERLVAIFSNKIDAEISKDSIQVSRFLPTTTYKIKISK